LKIQIHWICQSFWKQIFFYTFQTCAFLWNWDFACRKHFLTKTVELILNTWRKTRKLLTIRWNRKVTAPLTHLHFWQLRIYCNHLSWFAKKLSYPHFNLTPEAFLSNIEFFSVSSRWHVSLRVEPWPRRFGSTTKFLLLFDKNLYMDPCASLLFSEIWV